MQFEPGDMYLEEEKGELLYIYTRNEEGRWYRAKHEMPIMDRTMQSILEISDYPRTIIFLRGDKELWRHDGI